jgi:hypothetical protein
MTAPGTSESASMSFVVSERWLPIWSVVAAFGAYFCMYAFRKPFTAAGFADQSFGSVGFKTILVTSQVFGYMTAKFIGIKVISEIQPHRRPIGILAMILGAELSLILFAVTSAPGSALMLFFNGLNLGMVFGLVLGFLEGRKQTEALTAGLCASFILADGMTKSAGSYLLQAGVSETAMPALTGLAFLPPTLLFVWMLSKIPAPNHDDREARSERTQMTREDRVRFVRKYAGGLVPLMFCYLFVTILRSIRADFAPELWKDLGTTGQPAVFTRSELLVTLGVMLSSGLSIYIRDNRRAFFLSLFNSIVGLAIILAAVFAWLAQAVTGFTLMVLVGFGLYLPYVSVHTTVFERFLAMTRDKGNIGFLMYLADSFGYLGYVAVMLTRNYFGAPDDFLDFYLSTCIVLGIASIACLVISMSAFRKIRPATTEEAVATLPVA